MCSIIIEPFCLQLAEYWLNLTENKVIYCKYVLENSNESCTFLFWGKLGLIVGVVFHILMGKTSTKFDLLNIVASTLKS